MSSEFKKKRSRRQSLVYRKARDISFDRLEASHAAWRIIEKLYSKSERETTTTHIPTRPQYQQQPTRATTRAQLLAPKQHIHLSTRSLASQISPRIQRRIHPRSRVFRAANSFVLMQPATENPHGSNLALQFLQRRQIRQQPRLDLLRHADWR